MNTQHQHIVPLSGGLGSWQTGKRVAAAYGTDRLTLLFTDVKGNNPSRHAGEDIDAYRFLVQSAADIFGRKVTFGDTPDALTERAREEVAAHPDGEPADVPVHARYLYYRQVAADQLSDALVWLIEGRDIWQVYKDDRMLGNSRLANCSSFLKQTPTRAWLDANCDPQHTTVYVGIDIYEIERTKEITAGYAHPVRTPCARRRPCRDPHTKRQCTPEHPLDQCTDEDPCRGRRPCTDEDPCRKRLEHPWRAEFPMCEKPYLDKSKMQLACLQAGMPLPRLYLAGAPHNNCGGGCVRAGQGQFEMLHRIDPDRLAYWERKERELQEFLGKPVTILKERVRDADVYAAARGGAATMSASKPLSLSQLRERIEDSPSLIDLTDVGGCACW